ncbi:MAG TPA: ATP-binding protein [Acidimicrobiales bacterium]|jgi:PAS domain S-box-containing protein
MTLESSGLDAGPERLTLAFEHAPIGIAFVSPAGRFTRVNAAMCQITGYSESELLERNIEDITHPDDVADGAARVAKLLSGVIAQYQAEKRYVRRDGRTVYTIVSRSMLRDADGRPELLLTHVVDISDKKRIEQELARSNADLADFAYLAAHDLKSPLQAISGFAGLLKEKVELDEPGQECVGWILDGAARMNALIDDLLAFCRVSSDAPVMVDVDLDEAFLEVLAETGLPSGQVVKTGSLPTLMGDPVQFRELLLNLITNGVKFVGDSVTPLVRLSAERSHGAWKLCVADNGIGIDPDQHQRIFGMFNRLHSRERYPGSGIGLAICQRIVERRGGHIWVEDNEGGGSRFCFTVPDSP